MYDPTIQCVPKSEYNDGWCTGDMTCDVASAYDCQFSSSPYSCSPSDLSGKYGSTGTDKTIAVKGWDDLMVPLAHLRTRYFGTYCSSSLTTTHCQSWDVSVQPTPSPTTSPTKRPTSHPSTPPTKRPTKHPTKHPSKLPSFPPTLAPSLSPTTPGPTGNPSQFPSPQPTVYPSVPTTPPSLGPSIAPTQSPSLSPSPRPTPIPTSSQASSAQTITTLICGLFALISLLWI
ncbi:hypothetical protein RFI_40291 [Reticulomyxa filosa]|uniref:Uncharacterized protein n=1 Tax=Reticulomyxa filosa TaxID=46433 RepID=X6L7D7_RETFI|nr:hypothetical protein RFI_40291 [Reticulomyxa filosa]|eukprot:ETN97240.1 hypothetical protein RFI_40291 [Reticulomyxa filosa]